jgi:hypothetical protein
MNSTCFPADLAFADMHPESQAQMIRELLSELRSAVRTELLRNRDMLAVEIEAYGISMERIDAHELKRYLLPCALDRLKDLLNESLLADLPTLDGIVGATFNQAREPASYEIEHDHEHDEADFAFAGLSLAEQFETLEATLSAFDSDERAHLVTNVPRLSLVVEAHCIGLRLFEELARYLQPRCADRLNALIEQTLLARLPALS